MILQQPYDFRVLSLINQQNTVLNINKYISIDYSYIRNKEKLELKPFVGNGATLNTVVLYGLSDVEKEIPIFTHPLINAANNWIAIDLRNYVKVSNGEYEIRSEHEYELAIQRLIVTGMWYIGERSSLYGLKLAHSTFAGWLSDNLASKFGLDLHAKLLLKVLAMLYYSELFLEEITTDDVVKLKIRCKEDFIPEDVIDDVHSKAGSMKSIEDFCRACYRVTNNIRLQGLDFNTLSTILANNWIGSDSKSLVLLATEHPPTWIAILRSAITHRSYKRSFISSVVEKMDKRGKGDDFLKHYTAITKQYKIEE